MTLHNYHNPYDAQLTGAEIKADAHRCFVGGMWHEIGRLQCDFMCKQGLLPSHRLLDVGCGCLRGGVHFIRLLDPGHYYGIDMNASLIEAGRTVELPKAGLANRNPHLLVDEKFNFHLFNQTFHYALALSVFTHLPLNHIQTCLIKMAQVLEPGGRFMATYFESPRLHRLEPIRHESGIVTFADMDPFHYHFSVFPFLIQELPLRVTNLGSWGHPRGQHMLKFVRV